MGVRATDFSAASTVAASTVSMSGSRSAAATAASAASRITVRIVPSTGWLTARYERSTPCRRANARSRPLNRRLRSRASAIPPRIWLRMTPELPRAPWSAPRLMAPAIVQAGSPATVSAPSSATCIVAAMFDPVSPSGTGNTLRALISSTCASRLATAARSASSRPDPSHQRRVIGLRSQRDRRREELHRGRRPARPRSPPGSRWSPSPRSPRSRSGSRRS